MEATVNRLKTELKRSLRKRVGGAVDDICDEFVEELKLPMTLPQTAASRNENDYECCRRFVEYIVRNMDTSPMFAEQMDCIILAYQSDAPVEVLNSVVTQNLWMRCEAPESSTEKTKFTDGQEKMKAKSSNSVAGVQSIAHDAPNKSVVGGVGSDGNWSVGSKEIDAIEAKPTAASPTNSKTEHANDNKRRESGFRFADILKGAPLVVAKTSKSAASKRKIPQNAQPRLSPRKPFAGLDEVSSVTIVGSRNAPVKVNLVPSETARGKGDVTGTGSRLPVKKAKPQISRRRINASQLNDSVVTTGSKNVLADASAAVTSRPREWGKRKRLVTGKRPNTAATSKRARRAELKHFEPSDLSSTETDNSDDDKASAVKETHSGENDREDQRIGSKVASASTKAMTTKALKPGVVITAPTRTMAIATQGAKTVAVQKKAPATSKNESNITKAGEQDAKVKVSKQVTSTNDHGENAVPEGGENKKGKAGRDNAQVGIETLRMENEKSTDEVLVDAELCHVERDLAAGDESDGLDAAKRSFQAMLNTVVGHQAIVSHLKVLNESSSNENVRAVADPIGNLCDAAQRSPDETCIFKMRLRDTISIVDALLCKPPRGHSCSRDCKAIRSQMCKEFAPCINPTCRVWHEAEAHSESCPDIQCEFKTRVVLRETMHLIEHKQQEVAKVHDALESANVALLSSTRRSNKERSTLGNAKAFKRIKKLQDDLQLVKAELAILIDTKKKHWATLNSIGVDSNSDKVDEFPDFASHYSTRILRRM